MIVEIGGRGLENSWQAPFPKTVECVHCKAIAYPVVCIQEDGKSEGDFICNLPPPPNPEEGEPPNSWLHDATAFAIYLCPKCLEPTALFNQA